MLQKWRESVERIGRGGASVVNETNYTRLQLKRFLAAMYVSLLECRVRALWNQVYGESMASYQHLQNDTLGVIRYSLIHFIAFRMFWKLCAQMLAHKNAIFPLKL